MSAGQVCWCGNAVTNTEENGFVCTGSELHAPFSDGRRTQHSRLYLAGPMSGYPEANYPAFNEAEASLVDAGYDVVNPVNTHPPRQCHYVDLLREDLQLLLQCHAVALLDKWWESVGARNEVQVAGLLLMPVRPVAEWAWNPLVL